jgi:hypothetical protein
VGEYFFDVLAVNRVPRHGVVSITGERHTVEREERYVAAVEAEDLGRAFPRVLERMHELLPSLETRVKSVTISPRSRPVSFDIPIRTSRWMPRNVVMLVADGSVATVVSMLELERRVAYLARPRAIALARHRARYRAHVRLLSAFP